MSYYCAKGRVLPLTLSPDEASRLGTKAMPDGSRLAYLERTGNYPGPLLLGFCVSEDVYASPMSAGNTEILICPVAAEELDEVSNFSRTSLEVDNRDKSLIMVFAR